MIFILFLSIFIHSEIKCPNNRVIISTPCYGECGNFIDENSNGICDIWEKYNKEKNHKKIVIEKNIKTKNIVLNNLLDNTTKDKDIKIENNNLNTDESKEKRKTNKLTRYGFIYIFMINLFLIILTEVFKKNIGSNFSRRVWNWLFLISMIICSLTGFFMYFNILEDYKNLLYQLHIQSSITTSIIALYHIMKRYKCL